MALGYFLHLRLFLEGIEVPVISANVSIAANTPAAASIQVIATDKVLNLLPRTVVHLFYYDYLGSSVLNQTGVALGDNAVDQRNSQYKLLFMGELQQIQFQKGAGQRAVILQCVDFSNYWDTTYQYNFGGSLFGGRRKAAFIGANSNFLTSPLGHGVGTISRLLTGNSVNFPELRGLLAGVVRMLEAIGGSYRGRNTFRGANDFTSIAELRLKILQQITAAEQDDSTAKLFARKAFNMWMNRQIGQLGRLVTFRGLVKMMFKFIFHEVYPCPVAKFVKAGKRKEPRRYSVGLGETKKYNPFVNQVEIAIWRIRFAQDNLGFWKADSDYYTLKRYVRSWTTAENAVKGVYVLGNALGSSGANAKIQGKLSVAQNQLKKIRTITAGDAISNLEEKYSSSLGRNYNTIVNLWKKAESALEDVLKIRIGRVTTKTVATEERVNNQIFRPDVWFTPPPRCNVLFPETYDQFSFGRNFMREVTRMELQTHNEILGNSALFNGRYYAPNVEDVRRGVRLSSRQFARFIMEHELYTGIIPMFENMTEANVFAMRGDKVKRSGAKVPYVQRAVNHQYFKYRFESRQMQASGRFNPIVVPGFPTLLIDRPMDITNLKISALPVGDQTKALGLQTNAKSAPTRAELLQQLVSPQYLGVLANLSHMVSQEGGRTQYAFKQARVHRESTEFLGIDQAEIRVPISGSGWTKPFLVACPLEYPPKVGSRGPHGGRITKVTNVTRRFTKAAGTTSSMDPKTGKTTKTKQAYVGKTLPLLGTDKRVVVGSSLPPSILNEVYTTDAPILSKESARKFMGVADTLSSIGQTLKEGFIEPFKSTPTILSTGLVAGAFEIVESTVQYRKEKITLPIEEAIAPPWLWDGWRNPKVGETYQQMFGTTAITDISNFKADDERYYVGEDAASAVQAERKLKASNKTSTKKELIAVDAKHKTAVLMIQQERTVENSIDFLVRAYSFVKANSLDVGDFLRAYSWRPVATMVDILGASDFQISRVEELYSYVVKQRYVKKAGETLTVVNAQTGKIVGTEETRKPVYGTRNVTKQRKRIRYDVSGKEGFHSRAFGDQEDLFGLVSPTVKRVLGLGKNRRKIAAKLDIRKRRRAEVRAYAAELTGSRGLLG